ncbi:hypothetical protein Tco_1550504, partial [Tanacetum coccineum]
LDDGASWSMEVDTGLNPELLEQQLFELEKQHLMEE